MPVPPLPLEVVSLIVDHGAASAEDEQERRRLGVRIALVCRAWQELGIRAAWRILTLDMDKDEHLLAFLLERPTVLSNVRELDIKGQRPFEEPEEHDDGTESAGTRSAVQRLFDTCPGVVKLLFDDFPPTIDLVDMASRSPMRVTVQKVTCSTLGLEGDISRLAAALSTFQHLHTLRVLAKFWGAQYPPPAEPTSKLKLRCLDLLLGTYLAADADTSVRAMLSACDISTLEKVQIAVIHSADVVLPLHTANSLTTLVLATVSPPIVRAILASLLTSLPSLINLRYLSINTKSYDTITYVQDDLSPIPLHTLLFAFPPSLQLVCLSGLYFEYDLSIIPQADPSIRLDSNNCGGTVIPCNTGKKGAPFDSAAVRDIYALRFPGSDGRMTWGLVLPDASQNANPEAESA
ncbi:hypothetical protein JCM6882_002365 [Rhodosporidiobolus microsporus]